MDQPACLQTVARLISPTAPERLDLAQALSRVNAARLNALLPHPGFRQSMRDGYVLTPADGEIGDTGVFPITGTMQAGSTEQLELRPGQACRIMTGAMIPTGGTRVIPQEECIEELDLIRVPLKTLARRESFVQETGSEIAVSETIVAAGTILLPEHIGLLATTGWREIEVFRRPRVSFFCTGSELVDAGMELQPGQKYSSNRHLLSGLIQRYGGEPCYMGTVVDTRSAMAETFARLRETAHDLVISTGGMGPGKYDLIEQAFTVAGGEVIYNSLDLIPGKNSLCGLLGGKLFFGLPGPPTAVHALMTAIVGPALLQLQGVSVPSPERLSAHLSHSLTIRRPGIMQLRGGVLSFADGRCLVRMAAKLEPPTCYMVIPAERVTYQHGELIEVQLVTTPFAARSR